MVWGRDEMPTKPDHEKPRQDSSPDTSIEFRHGLMMRELAELRDRIEALERIILRGSIRPVAKTAGLSGAVAGSVVAILELLRYAGVFGVLK